MEYMQDSIVIEKFELLVSNAARPEITPKLLIFGYHETVRQADEGLLIQVRGARATQQKEYAEAHAATAVEDQAKAAGRAAFLQLHRIIRMANRRDRSIDLKRVLQIGALPATEAAFLDYTAGLMDRIEASPEAQTALAYFGVDDGRIASLRELIQSVRQANITQQQELGEARQATAVYRELMEQVRLALDILTRLAREALADEPELLKLMGVG